MKYVDASAILRVVFREAGPAVSLTTGDRIVSSRLVEVETFRAIDRARLLGHLDDVQTALKRKELNDLLARLDVAAVDDAVIAGARSPFAVTLRVDYVLYILMSAYREFESRVGQTRLPRGAKTDQVAAAIRRCRSRSAWRTCSAPAPA